MRAVLLKILLRAFSPLPLSVNHRFGALLGHALLRLPNTLRTISQLNLRLCFPELDHNARRQLLRHNLIEIGKSMSETGALWRWNTDRVLALVREIRGKAVLDEAIEAGDGVILAIPHLGCWEMIGMYCSARHPMTSLYRPPRLAGLDSLIRQARQRAGAKLVPTDIQGVRRLYQALDQGEICAILPDQEPGPENGIFARFFDQPAWTMVLASRLAMKTGAAVIFSWAERLPAGKGFRLHFSKMDYDRNDGLDVITQRINDGVEACIRQCPEQYQWGYRRFRSQPDHAPSLYNRLLDEDRERGRRD